MFPLFVRVLLNLPTERSALKNFNCSAFDRKRNQNCRSVQYNFRDLTNSWFNSGESQEDFCTITSVNWDRLNRSKLNKPETTVHQETPIPRNCSAVLRERRMIEFCNRISQPEEARFNVIAPCHRGARESESGSGVSKRIPAGGPLISIIITSPYVFEPVFTMASSPVDAYWWRVYIRRAAEV